MCTNPGPTSLIPESGQSSESSQPGQLFIIPEEYDEEEIVVDRGKNEKNNTKTLKKKTRKPRIQCDDKSGICYFSGKPQ